MTRTSIALIGFMATGKTSVGRMLADQFGKKYKFIEMDDLIVEKAGKSIPEIFKDDGEIRFSCSSSCGLGWKTCGSYNH